MKVNRQEANVVFNQAETLKPQAQKVAALGIVNVQDSLEQAETLDTGDHSSNQLFGSASETLAISVGKGVEIPIQSRTEMLIDRSALEIKQLTDLKDLDLAPDEEEPSALELAEGRYADEFGNWNIEGIKHDMLNVANARRLIDDLWNYGADNHGFDPQGVFDGEDVDRLQQYADRLAGMMVGIPSDVFLRAADRADLDDPDVMRYMYGAGGLGGGLDGSRSHHQTVRNPGAQTPHVGPNQGGRHRQQPAGTNQPHGNPNSPPRPKGGEFNDGPEPVPYSAGATQDANDSHANNKDSSGSNHESSSGGDRTWEITEDDGWRLDVSETTDEDSDDLAPDPSTGQGGNGNDLGAHRPKQSPDNRAGFDQILQPGVNLVQTKTGADDKETPVLGNTSQSQQQSAGADDLGDDLPGRINTGPGGEAPPLGKALLDEIRPIDPNDPE